MTLPPRQSTSPSGAMKSRSAAMPFMIGDVWRGFLSSCHQSEVHQEREFRTFPFDLTIQKTNAPLGVVHVTFVSHYDKTEYRMRGIYNESVYRLFLRPEHSDISSAGWKPCGGDLGIVMTEDMPPMRVSPVM